MNHSPPVFMCVFCGGNPVAIERMTGRSIIAQAPQRGRGRAALWVRIGQENILTDCDVRWRGRVGKVYRMNERKGE